MLRGSPRENGSEVPSHTNTSDAPAERHGAIPGAQTDERRREHAVEVTDVRKQFGTVAAVAGIDLALRRGEFFSILGPSGCGKTTLLRLIGGFEFPDSGRILIGGRDVTFEPPYVRRTNMVFQHLALFPHMSVEQNIMFGLRMKRTPAAEMARRTEEMLRLVRLQGYGERRISQLSGGQQQRVAIARALVNDPDVLLLDEPLGALDLQLRLQLQLELKRIHSEIQNTFVFVTHDQTEAIALSDRIAVMDHGKVVQVGSCRDIYERPRTTFVARFIGNTNLFEGTVADRDAESTLVQMGDNLARSLSGASAARGRSVYLSIRYERIRLRRDEPGQEPVSPAVNRFPGRVLSCRYMGSTLRYEIAGPAETRWGVDLSAKEGNHVFAAGDPVLLECDAADIVVLEE